MARYLSLLNSCLFLLTYLINGLTANNHGDLTTSKFLKAFVFQASKKATAERQDMLLIGTGFGRTSTTSFEAAVGRLGLKSYNFAAMMKTHGHLETWLEFTRLRNEENTDKLIERLALDGFNATSSMPACFIHKELIERYPNARVVLTVRGDGDGMAWARSAEGSILSIYPIFQRIPLRWIPKLQGAMDMLKFIFAEAGVDIVADHTTFAMPSTEDLAAAYNSWVEGIKASIPSENLLVFAAKDGWEPLCEFLSPLDIQIKNNCDEILDSGEPYPFANDKASFQRLIRVLDKFATAFQMLPFAFVLVIMMWMQSRKSKVKGKKE